ncbi:MAG: Hsp33 family molecular chaperone HslO, partial [Lysobacterales bacterium]
MNVQSDRLRRFHIPALDTRGVWTHLDTAWQNVGAGHAYPAPVQTLLGQALAATALLTGNLKSSGRLSLQLKSTGDLRTLFTECDHLGHVRGIARLADGFAPAGEIDLSSLPEAIFGITLERPEHERYQVLIEVQHASLGAVLEGYFVQSEQLPTRVWLAADASRCAGLLLQQVAGVACVAGQTGANFEEASLLASTIKPEELLDLATETLL